jgi:aryl-alcohol dehydrogenase-like predicted oxidoreductase
MRLAMSNRLALGTAQFGLAYGVANQSGQINSNEASEILERGWAAGMDTLDTAIAYGESEQRLGALGVSQWKLISKLPPLPAACTDVAAWVQAELAGSLDRLRVSKLHGLLLHRSQQLFEPCGEALYVALREAKAQGLVNKIGVSVYGPEELEMLWPKFQLDLVQAPFNIVDRRLVSSGWLERMNKAGTEIHVRSVFLQGLLLMPTEKRRANFGDWQDLWSYWDGWLIAEKLTPLQAGLIFALSRPEIDRVIVGVDNTSQLNEILSVANTADIHRIDFPDYLESMDSLLTNPSKWKQL